ncbi:DUF5695 domain-containing protein [Lentilactobacillus raoultii]|uniref:DUF5695 domain-containing protein n=1 Tax=Lentilactobacillus raoultii TaxID=1987503 RepID=A0ABW3PN90_9LACO|nr:DUF5695 domain-containing protein [Lentilactobacillus raoultii]
MHKRVFIIGVSALLAATFALGPLPGSHGLTLADTKTAKVASSTSTPQSSSSSEISSSSSINGASSSSSANKGTSSSSSSLPDNQESSKPKQNTTSDDLIATDPDKTPGAVQPKQTADGYEISNNQFKVDIGKNGTIQGLYLSNDSFDTNYVMNTKSNPAQNTAGHEWVGDLIFQTQPGDNATGDVWQKEYTNSSDSTRKVSMSNNKVVVTYTPGKATNGIQNMGVTETYSLDNDGHLKWDITVKNDSNKDLTIGDFGLPLPFKEWWSYSGADKTIDAYQQSVVYHSFVGQNASYIYATRPSGIGNFLVMTPDASTGAGFEYQDHWGAGTHDYTSAENPWVQFNNGYDNGLSVFYIHSSAIQKTNQGYLNNTSLTLKPNESKTYSFKFSRSDIKNTTNNSSTSGDMTDTKYENQLKSILYKENIMDAVSVPGMIVPKKSDGDATGQLYLHTKVPANDISFDYQNQTNDYESKRSNPDNDTSSSLGSNEQGKVTYEKTITKNGEQYHLYHFDFHSLGRNNVIVKYKINGQPMQTTLQYYVIDNPEKALEQHANFMLKTQWKDSSKFYNDIFDDWDFNTQSKRGNFNGASNWGSLGWGDDWGLTHGLFLATQNVNTPNKDQVQALSNYLENGIWNGLMKNHHDDYRVPDWLDERVVGSSDKDNYSWRGWAYPHIYNTFYEMYQVEKNNPNLIKYPESAKDYLLKAYNIMKALYVTKATNNNDGLEGESTDPKIIAALRSEGLGSEADTLQNLLKTKYNAFAKDPYPYTSEYPYDNTAEEGVYALGNMFNNQKMKQMVDMKTRASRSVQPTWYQYGVPVTINGESWWQFQYTDSLAGTAMDNWLREQNNGMDQDQLGLAERANYAAKMGNLTHINSGQIDKNNIGAVAWYYQASLGNITREHYGVGAGKMHNGWIPLSGEADLSLFGALQVLSADVVNDPIFGLVGYGADVQDNGSSLSVTPEDGLRTRLNLIDQHLSYEFNGDKYTHADVKEDGTSTTFDFQNVSKAKHNANLTIYDGNGFDNATYNVLYNGQQVTSFKGAEGGTKKQVELSIPVTAQDGKLQIVKAGTNNNNNSNNGGSSSTTVPSSTNNSTTSSSASSSSSSSSSSQPATSSSSTSASSQSQTNANKLAVPKKAAKVGTTIYAVKKLALYEHATFKKSQRLATYKKASRTNRPMFIVEGYARSENGVLRYKVKDVNHGSKAAGKIGYITAKSQYVSPVYYRSVPKSKTLTVISKNGVNAYRSKALKGKLKHYKRGTRLKVKKIVNYHLTSRYVLHNGSYITGNKKLVIQGKY